MIESLSSNLKDKIFEIKFDSDNTVSKIISYFVLSDQEKQTISSILKNKFFNEFYSIFSDTITDDEWNKTKSQIRKKFNDELLDIDKISKIRCQVSQVVRRLSRKQLRESVQGLESLTWRRVNS